MFPFLSPECSAVHVEWCKIRARAHRWAEEVELLVEEQHRVIEFLHWQSKWWLDRQALVQADPTFQEGLKAYAIRQATLREPLEKQFRRVWNDTQRYIELADGNKNCVEMYSEHLLCTTGTA